MQNRQVRECVRHLGVVLAKVLLVDLERALVQRQCLVVLALLVVQDGQVGAGLRHVGVGGAQLVLARGQLRFKRRRVVCVVVVVAVVLAVMMEVCTRDGDMKG